MQQYFIAEHENEGESASSALQMPDLTNRFCQHKFLIEAFLFVKSNMSLFCSLNQDLYFKSQAERRFLFALSIYEFFGAEEQRSMKTMKDLLLFPTRHLPRVR